MKSARVLSGSISWHETSRMPQIAQAKGASGKIQRQSVGVDDLAAVSSPDNNDHCDRSAKSFRREVLALVGGIEDRGERCVKSW